VGGPGRPSLARLQGGLAYQQTLLADARRVRLPRVFDVVVSEMVGNEAFEEGLVPGRLDVEIDWNPARRRWSCRFEGDRGARAEATHSPLFAWGVVRPAIPGRR